jgi:hypothetical protein
MELWQMETGAKITVKTEVAESKKVKVKKGSCEEGKEGRGEGGGGGGEEEEEEEEEEERRRRRR